MYSNVVLGLDHHMFEEILDDIRTAGRHLDTDLTADDWEKVSPTTRPRSKAELGQALPAGPAEQLWGAIGAVFASWMNDRAISSIAAARHPRELGHGRQRAGHGVRQHGRDLRHRRGLHPQPVDRREAFYGEFLINAQGEDVVAGIRTPQQS
jgi:pyruvate,orthophosphate dikinase